MLLSRGWPKMKLEVKRWLFGDHFCFVLKVQGFMISMGEQKTRQDFPLTHVSAALSPKLNPLKIPKAMTCQFLLRSSNNYLLIVLFGSGQCQNLMQLSWLGKWCVRKVSEFCWSKTSACGAKYEDVWWVRLWSAVTICLLAVFCLQLPSHNS